jgi:hypothetical protein
MISVAVLRVDVSEPFTGNSTTDTPPCRSRPSSGRFDDTSVATNEPTMMTTVAVSMIT